MGREVQSAIKAGKAGHWERRKDSTVVVAGRTLADDEYTLRLVPRRRLLPELQLAFRLRQIR